MVSIFERFRHISRQGETFYTKKQATQLLCKKALVMKGGFEGSWNDERHSIICFRFVAPFRPYSRTIDDGDMAICDNFTNCRAEKN